MVHGLPPKGASCTSPSGYWVQAARVLCNKENPSYPYVKAVANHFYSDIKGVQSFVISKFNSSSGEHQQSEVKNDNHKSNRYDTYTINIIVRLCL